MKDYKIYKDVRTDRCNTIGCKNKPSGKFCGTCRARQSRLRDPIRYSYNNLKHRADERGVFFDLTLDEFREFCYETKYIQKKGREVGSHNVDRKIEGKLPEYTRSNIQSLEKIKNITKYVAWDAERRQLRACLLPESEPVPAEDLPF